MKPGDMVRTAVFRAKLNLYEGIRDDEKPSETGEAFFANETGLIMETYHGIGNHVYHRILTSQGCIGWVHEFHIKVIR